MTPAGHRAVPCGPQVSEITDGDLMVLVMSEIAEGDLTMLVMSEITDGDLARGF